MQWSLEVIFDSPGIRRLTELSEDVKPRSLLGCLDVLLRVPIYRNLLLWLSLEVQKPKEA